MTDIYKPRSDPVRHQNCQYHDLEIPGLNNCERWVSLFDTLFDTSSMLGGFYKIEMMETVVIPTTVVLMYIYSTLHSRLYFHKYYLMIYHAVGKI